MSHSNVSESFASVNSDAARTCRQDQAQHGDGDEVLENLKTAKPVTRDMAALQPQRRSVVQPGVGW